MSENGPSTTDLSKDSTDRVLIDCTDILTNEGRTGDFVPLKTPGERAELLQSLPRNKKKMKMKKKGKRKFYIYTLFHLIISKLVIFGPH